ncbi:fructosamine kinase family protein [Streptomyces sp. NPDC021224]|uniref:fructosamine kinase family protein n=1 Tax=unclassified Streptomyces TaxID=2593676 RepID=UPI0037B05AE9
MSGGAAAAVARLTGLRVTGERRVSGALAEVELDGGRVVMAKHTTAPGAVAAEAAGLEWLAAARAVRIPAVRGCDGQWLVTDRVAEGPATPAGAERFGRALAALHASGVPAFGAAPPGGPEQAYIGAAPMRNVPGSDWPGWYAGQRVLPYLRTAVDAGDLGAADAAAVERVCARLPELAGPAEPPARLHGDLWSGNVLWGADGEVRLIDPAAHGGHRETDLAMLRLFGCPHLDRVLAAYAEAAPLAPGAGARVPLHQLFPLLVHTVLFGAGYGRQAGAAARASLAA